MDQHIQRILLATDFSFCSDSALDYAVMWAKICEAELDCLHVTELHPHMDMDGAVVHAYLEEQQNQAKQFLDKAVLHAQASHPPTRAHERTGSPEREICKFALEQGSDLIVVGTHGWSGFNRVLLGSVAERVVCHAPCPVISVRSKETTATTPPGGTAERGERPSAPLHVLIPLDFSDCSLDAVEFGAQIAKIFDITVTLLHVKEAYGYGVDFILDLHGDQRIHDDQVKKQLEKLSRTFKEKGITATSLVKTFPTPLAILQGVEEAGANLIVMGTHGRSGLPKLLMGSNAANVLRQSPIPVLTVKAGKYAHDHPKRSRQSASTQ